MYLFSFTFPILASKERIHTKEEHEFLLVKGKYLSFSGLGDGAA